MTTPRDFAIALLYQLGVPTDDNNVTSLVSAQAAEGGFMNNTAAYNPLNVTQAGWGSTLAPGFSSPAIQAYPNWASGLAATTALLKNGFYDDILSALASGATPETTLAVWAKNPHYGWTYTPPVNTAYGSETFPTGPSATPLVVPPQGAFQAPSFAPSITQAGVGAVLAYGFWELYKVLGRR